MKLLTINTHSLIESEYENKLIQFVDMLDNERPDIIAMQEVNQPISEEVIPDEELEGFVRNPDFKVPIRRGNHAARVVELLREKGLFYEWTWISAKLGYSKYDEGIAFLSLKPIKETRQVLISKINDYRNWKTRRCIGVQVEGMEDSWFYSVHMGWWDDEEEPFSKQWDCFMKHLEESVKEHQTVWIMGDFNSPTHGPGYLHICKSGWLDCYKLALVKDSGVTVEEVIDGWRERSEQVEQAEQEDSGMRLDYIFCNKYEAVLSSKVVCNGRYYPVISDHYGVLMEVGEIAED